MTVSSRLINVPNFSDDVFSRGNQIVYQIDEYRGGVSGVLNHETFRALLNDDSDPRHELAVELNRLLESVSHHRDMFVDVMQRLSRVCSELEDVESFRRDRA